MAMRRGIKPVIAIEPEIRMALVWVMGVLVIMKLTEKAAAEIFEVKFELRDW